MVHSPEQWTYRLHRYSTYRPTGYLLHCVLSLAAQYIVICPVCGFVTAGTNPQTGQTVSEPYYSQRARCLCLSERFFQFICVLTTYKAYNLYNNKPQAATEFSAKLDVCRIQYCSHSQVLSAGDVGFSVSSSSIIIIIIVRYQQVIDT